MVVSLTTQEEFICEGGGGPFVGGLLDDWSIGVVRGRGLICGRLH